ncbi:MAG: PAS domain S-box protein [Pseudomonadota bacterium]
MPGVIRAAGLAAVTFLLLCGFSADAWSQARRLQQQADQSYGLERVMSRLQALSPSADESSLQVVLDQLVRDPELGFRFLALRDAGGRVRATAGRYEHWPLRWVPADVVLQLRELIYAFTGRHGVLALEGDAGGASLEYTLGIPDRRAWQDEAIARLTRYSTLGFLLGLTGLLALAVVLRRREGAKSSAPSSTARWDPRATSSRDIPDLLAQAGLGLILLDRSLRVSRLNAIAETLTGWVATDARDQQVFSVARLRGVADQPLDAELQAAWQVNASAPVRLDAWIQTRGGARRRVGAVAALLRDSGGPTGAMLLLSDASPRHAELEKLRQAARLPQALMDCLDEGVLQTDVSGVIRYANERVRAWLGYAPDELQGEGIGKLLPVPFMHQSEVKIADYASGSSTLPAVVAWHKNGTAVAVELMVEPLPGEEGLAVMLRPRKLETKD